MGMKVPVPGDAVLNTYLHTLPAAVVVVEMYSIVEGLKREAPMPLADATAPQAEVDHVDVIVAEVPLLLWRYDRPGEL